VQPCSIMLLCTEVMALPWHHLSVRFKSGTQARFSRKVQLSSSRLTCQVEMAPWLGFCGRTQAGRGQGQGLVHEVASCCGSSGHQTAAHCR
jgi:hypothetical protein